jgi:hypothetical protein
MAGPGIIFKVRFMKNKWRDITPYSKGIKLEDRIPTIFRLIIGNYFLIDVCYSHIRFKNEWIIYCNGLFEHWQTGYKKPEDLPKVKEMAIRKIKKIFELAIKDLSKELEG